VCIKGSQEPKDAYHRDVRTALEAHNIGWAIWFKVASDEVLGLDTALPPVQGTVGTLPRQNSPGHVHANISVLSNTSSVTLKVFSETYATMTIYDLIGNRVYSTAVENSRIVIPREILPVGNVIVSTGHNISKWPNSKSPDCGRDSMRDWRGSASGLLDRNTDHHT
jgi:hypothetical protein